MSSYTADTIRYCDTEPLDRLPAPQRLELYYFMKFSRKGLAFGKHLSCAGHEAIAVGAAMALRRDDWATTAIRDLGVFLVRGIPAARILAQACGREAGLTGGWDGSLHMGSRSAKIAGLVSHLGTLIPVATGCAFAETYRNTDNAVLAFMGEGSSSTGDFHEALNIASVLHLPLVVVIENNQWAFGTPVHLQYAVPTLALRSRAYGRTVEGYLVDGTDVAAVFQTVGQALDRARHDNVISIVEAVTMRFNGHSLADPFVTYVPSEQLDLWRKKEPVANFRQRLIAEGFAAADEVEAIDTRVASEISDAALRAERSAVPDATDISKSVFTPSPAHNLSLVDPPTSGSVMTYHAAIRGALQEEMERDSDLFMIGEDIGLSNGAFKITEGFSRRFDQIDWPACWKSKQSLRQRRVVDAPIAEAGFTGLVLGAALNGLRAVVEIQYADFASEAFKMIVNYAATETVRGMGPVPVVFRLPSGWAPNTSIYHSVNPESWFASTPGLKIVAPITAFDAKGLLKAAIRDNNPVLFLEYKAHYRIPPNCLPAALNLQVPQEDYVVPIGKARIVKQGRDVSLISYGSQTVRAVEAELLEKDGVAVEVIDLRSLVPYDADCIRRSVSKTGRAVVSCEAPRTGCFGNTIVAEIMRSSFEFLEAPVQLVAAADTPVPFSPVLEQAHLPTTEKLVQAMWDVLKF